MTDDLASGRSRSLAWPLAVLLLALAVFLVSAHYIKAASDPFNWLSLGYRWLAGYPPVGGSAPLFPLILAAGLKLAGRTWIFLFNTPFLILLALIVWRFTAQGWRGAGDRAPRSQDLAGFAGLAAVSLFILFNQGYFLELQNPYREASAYALMLGGASLLLGFLDRRGYWRAALSALLIGLATGIRETCILMTLPVGLILVFRWIRDRDSRWFKGLLAFGAGLLVGLAPFFIQNHAVSGRFWMPSYAAMKWTLMSDGLLPGGRDIPIPGMSVKYFAETGSSILGYLLGKYAWWGIALGAAGVLSGLFRRNSVASLFILPAFLFNLLFYSFWHTQTWRFCFALDLFAVPLMGLGAAELLSAVLLVGPGRWPGRSRRNASALPWAAAWTLALIMSAWLVKGALAPHTGLQAWDVRKLKQWLVPQLDQPAVFATREHGTHALSWLLDIPFTLRIPEVDFGDFDRGDDINGALRKTGLATLRALDQEKSYCLEKPLPEFYRQWAEFEPGPSLEDSPVPLGVRSRLMRIVPWRNTEVRRRVTLPERGGRQVLLLDCFRLWDYTNRTACRLSLDGRTVMETVPNGVSFVEIDPSASADGVVDLALESDAGLPPHLEPGVLTLNQKLILSFGYDPNGWCYSLLSPGFLTSIPRNRDSVFLTDRGTVTLPRFCDRRHEVIAEFRVLAKADRRKPDPAAVLILRTDREEVRVPLSAGDEPAVARLNLGRGTGRLDWVPVRIELSPPRSGKLALVAGRILAGPYACFADVRLRAIPVGAMKKSP